MDFIEVVAQLFELMGLIKRAY